MTTICRLCLQKDESVNKISIFDLNLSDTLYWIFGVEIDVGDSYSKLICSKCLYIVKYVLRIQKLFQTNQYILRERVCPVDFDVECANGTRDVGTSTEYQPCDNLLSISIDTLAKINRPCVTIKKFEESEIYNDYRKISKHCYRQKKRKKIEKTAPDIAKEERLSVPIVIFRKFPFVQLPKLESTHIQEGYEKINDYLYKELPKRSQIYAKDEHLKDKTEKYFETHQLPNDVQVTAEDRHLNDKAVKFSETHQLPNEVQVTTEDRHLNDNAVKYFETHQLPNEVQVTTEDRHLNDKAMKFSETRQLPNGVQVTTEDRHLNDKAVKYFETHQLPNEVQVTTVDRYLNNKAVTYFETHQLSNDVQVTSEDRHLNNKAVTYFETHQLSNDVQVITEVEESEKDGGTHASKCDMVTVPTSVFDLFNSPYVDVHKLDNSLWEKEYKKIDGFVYREVPSTLRARKVKNYTNYYYNLPTSALKELMMERQQEINGERSLGLLKNSRDRNAPLVDINGEVSVIVCKHCSQNFINIELLKIHCNVKHNESKMFPKIVKPKKKKIAKKVLKVDPPSPLNDISQNEKKSGLTIRPEVLSAHKISNRMQFKKIKKLPSLFEKMSLGKKFRTESKNMHFKKKWMASNDPTIGNIAISGNCPISENYEETSKNNTQPSIPTETYVYKQQEVIWFPEVVGCETPYDYDKSDFLTSDDETSDKESKDEDYVISLRNKLSSRLKANSKECTTSAVKEPLDKETADFIQQRLSDVKKTREEIDSMKKLLDALRTEIIQGNLYNEKCDTIMNLLSDDKTL